MKDSNLLLIFLISILAITSCGGKDGSDGSDVTVVGTPPSTPEPPTEPTPTPTPTPTGRPARMVYDSELSASERVALDNSTATLGRLSINGNVIPKFSQVFGGSRSSNVVNYVETRVNYAFSAATNLNDRVVLNKRFSQHYLAQNASTHYWFWSLYFEDVDGLNLQMRVNNRLVDINSTRVGLMQFGSPFLGLTGIEQAITIVHEGRHSDCTGGVAVSDVVRYINGVDMENPRCGHVHRRCPPGHPDEGTYACDEHAWGAYAVNAIYAFAISESCTNCSPAEKEVAEVMGIVSRNRLLYSFSDLLNGVYGSPNMSSSTQVRQE